jgi:hypothetical protein
LLEFSLGDGSSMESECESEHRPSFGGSVVGVGKEPITARVPTPQGMDPLPHLGPQERPAGSLLDASVLGATSNCGFSDRGHASLQASLVMSKGCASSGVASAKTFDTFYLAEYLLEEKVVGVEETPHNNEAVPRRPALGDRVCVTMPSCQSG